MLISEIKREVDNQKTNTELKEKTNKVICDNYNNENLQEILPYKEAIYNYLNELGNNDLLKDNNQNLLLLVSIYYKYLKNKTISLKDLIYAQSQTTDNNNFITNEIIRRYNASKNILVTVAKSNLGNNTDNNEINKMISMILNEFKTTNNQESFNDVLRQAIVTMTYLQSNTNLYLTPYLEEEKNNTRKK